MQRPDWFSDQLPAIAALPIDLVAGRQIEQHGGPVRAWIELGGTGTQRSSQISTPTMSPLTIFASKSKSVPKGTYIGLSAQSYHGKRNFC